MTSDAGRVHEMEIEAEQIDLHEYTQCYTYMRKLAWPLVKLITDLGQFKCLTLFLTSHFSTARAPST